MAAVIAAIGGLCGFFRKPQLPDGKSQTQSSPPATTAGEANDDLQLKETAKPELNITEENNSDMNRELPLPPARKVLQETYSCNNMMMKSKSTTTRKLSSSLTMKIPRTMSMRKTRVDEGDYNKLEKKKKNKNKKLKNENSIVVRPIILGEKCRVPEDEDEDEDDEDEDLGLKEQRVKTYHPRSASLRSLSRIDSKIDLNAIPGRDISKDSLRKREKNEEKDGGDEGEEEDREKDR